MTSPTHRMPAEWEPQAATLLAWPHNKNDWPGKFGPIPWVYTEIIRALTQTQRVRLVVRNAREEATARDHCERAGIAMDKLDLTIIPTNRIWLRDSGPIFVKEVASNELRVASKDSSLQLATRNSQLLLDFRFNAWAKYPDHKLDNRIPERLNETYNLPRIQPTHNGRRVVLEGGSIDVNGAGSILTTEECLLSPVQERNPGFTREDYEQVFARYLGAPNVIWLGRGIEGDDTHGHVDDLARFTDATTIATVVERDKRHANYTPLQDNLKRLKAARDQNGKPFTIAELPMPRPLAFEGQILPASYANFLIANGIVLVPTFNDPADRTALSILAELFPKREVVGIHCLDLVWGLGTIHCMSQQVPQ